MGRSLWAEHWVEPGRGGALGRSLWRRSLAGAEPEAPLPPQSPAGLAQKRLWDAHAVTRPLGGTKDRRRPGHLTRASCRGRHPTAPHRGRFRSSTLHRFLIPPTLFYSLFFFNFTLTLKVKHHSKRKSAFSFLNTCSENWSSNILG